MSKQETREHRVRCVRCEKVYMRSYAHAINRISYFICADCFGGTELARDQDNNHLYVCGRCKAENRFERDHVPLPSPGADLVRCTKCKINLCDYHDS